MRVFVGMSGGVDSSVVAALLKQQGHDVTGVYMKNWSQDLPGFKCPWREDYQDAKRVAVQLGIAFKMYDFEKDYRQKVVDYMLAEYQAGRTPNPDIMCNQEVKFKLFLETALEDGADMIATGHYATIKEGLAPPLASEINSDVSSRPMGLASGALSEDKVGLFMAADKSKDQTYFLYRVSQAALSKTLFPLGELKKTEVRAKAKELGLVTANKKESMGICFVGKVGIRDFLLSELGPQPPGDIIDASGRVIGRHTGAIFYTIGQRHGLDLGGGLPYYVTGKDMAKNEVYVTNDLSSQQLWRHSCELADVHWIGAVSHTATGVKARIRHRGELVEVSYDTNTHKLSFKDDIKGLSPGQSAVLYRGGQCLGGGIIV